MGCLIPMDHIWKGVQSASRQQWFLSSGATITSQYKAPSSEISRWPDGCRNFVTIVSNPTLQSKGASLSLYQSPVPSTAGASITTYKAEEQQSESSDELLASHCCSLRAFYLHFKNDTFTRQDKFVLPQPWQQEVIRDSTILTRNSGIAGDHNRDTSAYKKRFALSFNDSGWW